MADTKTRENNRIKVLSMFIVLLALYISVFIFSLNVGKFNYLNIKRTNSTSIFVSQYSTDNFKSEMLEKYLGGSIYVCRENSLREIGDCLKYSIEEKNMSVVRIGIDPMNNNYSFAAGNKVGRYINKSFYEVIRENPEVRFEILLYSPDAKEWNKHDIDRVIKSYEQLVNSVDTFDNVVVYLPGAEEWVLSNSQVVSQSGFEASIAEEYCASCFASALYHIDSSNQWEKYENIKKICEQTKNAEYIDLSGYEIVFFGDSVIGNYKGVSSIPEAVSSLSRAQCINMGVGGALGCKDFEVKVEEYIESNDVREKRIYVINYGLNDFFQGVNPKGEDAGTFESGIKSGINKIREYDPEGMIIVCGPTYSYFCNEDGNGTLKENAPVISEYIGVLQEIALENNVKFVNCYSELGVDYYNYEEYLLDGVHPNGNCRMIYAKNLLSHIEEWVD